MLATACSNDEVVKVAPQTGAIGFSSFVNNSTRADYDTDNLPADIEVFGLTSRKESSEGANDGVPATLIFDNEVLTKVGNWTYSPARYWVPGNDYSFAAFAPSTNSNVSNKIMTAENGLTFTFNNKDAGAIEDLLYAGWSGKEANSKNGTVEFTFSHMLSRVRFQFDSNVVNENINISVSDIQITNAASSADFTAVNGEGKMVWEKAGDDLTVEFASDGKQLIKEDSETSATMYLIPMSTDKAYTVKFNVTLYQKDLADATGKTFVEMATYPHTVTIPAQTYKSNFSYTFKASITDDTISEDELKPILFDVVGVDGWIEQNATDVAVKKTETPDAGE